jgi:hypothetical protein
LEGGKIKENREEIDGLYCFVSEIATGTLIYAV